MEAELAMYTPDVLLTSPNQLVENSIVETIIETFESN